MSQFKRNSKAAASLLALLFAIGLLVGALATFYVNYRQVNNLNAQVQSLSDEVSALQGQLSQISTSGSVTVRNETIIVYQNATELADIYEQVRDSVVLVQGGTSTGDVQGSGFVYTYSGKMVVITNFHVVYETTSLSVTFSDGRGYDAKVLGTDPYSDLAVVEVSDAPSDAFNPVNMVSSSSLRVGQQVIAIGNPYGLVGSLTTGIVSALGRTLQESDYTANFSIANVIQMSTPINPGNSGGPLLNAVGDVVGITTAIVSDSQGLGFAIPSNTILKEVSALVTSGTYRAHSYLGIYGNDMTLDQAKQMNVSVTYGWRVDSTAPGGPSDGKLQSGDVIIALNGTTIKNNDDLATYLEDKTLPGDLLRVTVVRDNQETVVSVTLGTRPPPPV
ncbi:MAG: trypsin-like peptidase domain-containing protein [Candidatus Bathyarchaeia archaeon]